MTGTYIPLPKNTANDAVLVEEKNPLTNIEVNNFPATQQVSLVEGSALGSGDLKLDAWGIQKFSRAQSLFHSKWTLCTGLQDL